MNLEQALAYVTEQPAAGPRRRHRERPEEGLEGRHARVREADVGGAEEDPLHARLVRPGHVAPRQGRRLKGGEEDQGQEGEGEGAGDRARQGARGVREEAEALLKNQEMARKSQSTEEKKEDREGSGRSTAR
jgi:hypothetical protein